MESYSFESCAKQTQSGNRWITCPRCQGEGEVLTYSALVYEWRHYIDKEAVLSKPVNRWRVRKLVEETDEEGDAIRVDTLEPEEVIAKLGFADNHLRECATAAKQVSERYAKRSDRGRLVLHDQSWRYVPLAYLNVQLGRKFGQFFSFGRGNVRNVLPPSQALCPWRSSFWLSLLVVIVMVSVQAVWPDQAFSSWWLMGPGLLLPLAIWRYVLDRRRPAKPLWLIMDDGDGGGWQFCSQVTKAWALGAVAKIEDPYYTVLFAEDQQERRSRNSFMCRLTEMTSRNPRELELLYLQPQAVARAVKDVVWLASQAQRLIWVSGKAAGQLDGEIAAFLGQSQQPQTFEVFVVADGTSYLHENFTMTRQALGNKTLHLLNGEKPDELLAALASPWHSTTEKH
jgi:hypothetical protein